MMCLALQGLGFSEENTTALLRGWLNRSEPCHSDDFVDWLWKTPRGEEGAPGHSAVGAPWPGAGPSQSSGQRASAEKLQEQARAAAQKAQVLLECVEAAKQNLGSEATATPGQETYERNTVSQGWKAYRCESDCHGHKCDDNGKRDNCADKYTVDYMRARTSCASKSIRWNEPILDRSGDVVQIASPGPDIDINASIMVYVPPVVADVPSFFRCPTALYNPLCVRVGDLATAELEEAAENRYIYMRAMAIVLGVFGFLCLNGWCFTAALYQMYQRNKRRFAERAAAAPPPQIVATVGQPVPVATAVPMVAATTVGQPVPVAMAVATPVA